VIIGTIAMSLNVVFSLLFSYLFSRIGWAPHGGLALANSFATALEMIGLLVLMRRRLNGLDGSRVLRGVLQAGAATLAMCLALWVWTVKIPGLPVWLEAAGGVIAGGVVYAAMVMALGVQEVRSLFKELALKLR
jgi:putative peptidoglycan lipid II flippase